MAKMSKALLRWRAEQKRGAIMKPETFDKIARESGKEQAGAAYWRAAKRKYAQYKRKNA